MLFQPTKELIREIAILELEVMHLEQYLLSLYRKAFDQQASALSPTGGEISRKPMNSRSAQLEEASKSEICSKIENSAVQSSHRQKHFSERVLGPGVHRSHSSLSQRMVFSARISPSEDSLARALHSFHSQPLSFLEVVQIPNPFNFRFLLAVEFVPNAWLFLQSLILVVSDHLCTGRICCFFGGYKLS